MLRELPVWASDFEDRIYKVLAVREPPRGGQRCGVEPERPPPW